MNQPLERLGRAVAQAQDELLERRDDLAQARAALLANQTRPAPRPGRLHARGFTAFALGAAALALATVAARSFLERPQAATPPHEAPAVAEPAAETPAPAPVEESSEVAQAARAPSKSALRFTVDGRRSGRAGEWLSAPAERSLLLRFSDGSEVELRPGSDLRVGRVGVEGALLQLERGHARLSIQHRPGTRWAVQAGPFSIAVVGTQFDVSWERDARAFGMEMHSGAVELEGPVLGKRRVVGGEIVRVSVAQRKSQIEQARGDDAASGREPLAAGESEPQGAAEPALAREPEPATARAARVTSASTRGGVKWVAASEHERKGPSFEALAREARYEEAVEAAVDAGWDRTLAEAPARSLLLLGDAARLSRDVARAEQAYVQLRARFPATSEAARAAFALGRLAYDQRERPADAARWFRIYLRELPRGPLAREAHGRLMEAELASDQLEPARESARGYLHAYPEGPHAPLARSLLGRPR